MRPFTADAVPAALDRSRGPAIAQNRRVTVIQSAPWRRNLPTIVGASIVLGLVLSRLFASVAPDAGSQVVAVIGCGIVAFAAIAGGMHLAYRPFAFDAASGTARIGRRTVPIDSIREAWRSLSANPRSANLVYRFRSTQGPTVRVLVSGRPIRGLDAAGLDALTDFVRLVRTDIDDDAALRGAVVSDLVSDGRKTPVSAAVLLRELTGLQSAVARHGEPAAAPAEEAPTTVPASGGRTLSEEERSAMHRDDERAAQELAALPITARAVRRVGGLLLGLTLVASLVLAGAAIVVESTGGEVGDAGGWWVLALLVSFTIGGLSWCIAADADVRQRRDAALRWLASADEGQRRRGLPGPYAVAWTEPAPGHRTLTVLAFGAGVLGLGLVLAAIVLPTVEPAQIGLVLPLGLGGAVFSGLGIWFALVRSRRKRADAAWVVEALGERIG